MQQGQQPGTACCAVRWLSVLWCVVLCCVVLSCAVLCGAGARRGEMNHPNHKKTKQHSTHTAHTQRTPRTAQYTTVPQHIIPQLSTVQHSTSVKKQARKRFQDSILTVIDRGGRWCYPLSALLQVTSYQELKQKTQFQHINMPSFMMLTAQHQRADSHDKDQRNIASLPKRFKTRLKLTIWFQTERTW